MDAQEKDNLEATTCNRCGAGFDYDDMEHTPDGMNYCPDCFDEMHPDSVG